MVFARPRTVEFEGGATRRIGIGVGAGLFAGIIMAVLAMMRSASQGLGLWLPLESIAAAFLGVEAYVAGPSAALLGALAHLAMSIFLGALFAMAIGTSVPRTLRVVIGIAYGIAIWAFMTYVVLPVANEVMLDRVMTSSGWWFFLHLVYGFVLGFEEMLPARPRPRHVPAGT